MKFKSIKIKKFLFILVMILLTILFCVIPVKANTTFGLDEMQNQGQNFIDRGNKNAAITTADAIKEFIPIGRTLVEIATIVLVVVGLIMGVKYMISGANEKAQLKQKLIYYVISIILVYGAVGIFTIIISVMNSIVG